MARHTLSCLNLNLLEIIVLYTLTLISILYFDNKIIFCPIDICNGMIYTEDD